MQRQETATWRTSRRSLRPRRRRRGVPEHFYIDVVMEDTETAAPDSGAAVRNRNLVDRKEEMRPRRRRQGVPEHFYIDVVEEDTKNPAPGIGCTGKRPQLGGQEGGVTPTETSTCSS